MAFFYDLFRLLGVFTFNRFFNIIALKWSFLISRITGNIIHRGHPAYISIEPITTCNLKCPQCFITSKEFTRPKGEMGFTTFEKIISQASPYAFYLNLYFQGEPFLNKNLIDFIIKAKQAKFYVAVSTNGHFLTENAVQLIIKSSLDKLIVSLDGADAETYNKYRINGNFETVVEGIKALTSGKKKNNNNHPFIELQFVVNKKNEPQVKEIKNLGKMLGVDKVTIKSLQLINFEDASNWLPIKTSRYESDSEGVYKSKSKLPNNCSRMWNSCVVTWDGNIIPCCFDKNACFIMGNIQTDLIQDIWRNSKYYNFRKKVFSERKSIDICSNCSED